MATGETKKEIEEQIKNLDSNNPSDRIIGLKYFSETKNPAVLDYLIPNLENDNLDLDFFSCNSNLLQEIFTKRNRSRSCD